MRVMYTNQTWWNLTSKFYISSVCDEPTHHFFLRYLVKFNGVFLFSWVTMLLVACTQMLCYFSFRPFRIHQRVLALVVNKSPVVFIFYRTLNKLWRENRGSVNRLCCWSPASQSVMLFLVKTLIVSIIVYNDLSYDWRYLTVYCLPNLPDFVKWIFVYAFVDISRLLISAFFNESKSCLCHLLRWRKNCWCQHFVMNKIVEAFFIFLL